MSDLVERLRKRADQFGMVLIDPPRPTTDNVLLNEAAARINALETEVEALRKALDETAEVLNLMDSEGVRAAAFTNVPEDGFIRELCERIGYGAVMDSAARQWFKKDSVGAITAGTCAGTLRSLKETVRRARLASTERSREET